MTLGDMQDWNIRIKSIYIPIILLAVMEMKDLSILINPVWQ